MKGKEAEERGGRKNLSHRKKRPSVSLTHLPSEGGPLRTSRGQKKTRNTQKEEGSLRATIKGGRAHLDNLAGGQTV